MPAPRRRAFTVVELLVVVAVVAVLVAILMPSLNAARRHAYRIQCANQLRQLGIAFIQYGNDNRGWFPGSGSGANNPRPEDWIHWHPGHDVNDSAVAHYLGRPADPAQFRCPSDEWASHRFTLIKPNTGEEFLSYTYFYSYCMNYCLGCDGSTTGYDTAGQYQAGRFVRVTRPSRTVLLLEVDERILMSGAWTVPYAGDGDDRYMWVQLLSTRHDAPRPRERWLPWFAPADSHPDARGNVAYVDGHVDFATRRSVHHPDGVLWFHSPFPYQWATP